MSVRVGLFLVAVLGSSQLCSGASSRRELGLQARTVAERAGLDLHSESLEKLEIESINRNFAGRALKAAALHTLVKCFPPPPGYKLCCPDFSYCKATAKPASNMRSYARSFVTGGTLMNVWYVGYCKGSAMQLQWFNTYYDATNCKGSALRGSPKLTWRAGGVCLHQSYVGKAPHVAVKDYSKSTPATGLSGRRTTSAYSEQCLRGRQGFNSSCAPCGSVYSVATSYSSYSWVRMCYKKKPVGVLGSFQAGQQAFCGGSHGKIIGTQGTVTTSPNKPPNICNTNWGLAIDIPVNPTFAPISIPTFPPMAFPFPI